MNMTQSLHWKLRRVAAGIRQQDIALRAGMSTTRYSAIEREEASQPHSEGVPRYVEPSWCAVPDNDADPTVSRVARLGTARAAMAGRGLDGLEAQR